MTAANLEHFGNQQHLTPHIDSLLQHGICFENAYSAGIHTNNGIFSTLYSYPSSWRVRPMSATKISTFTGFAGILKHFGYKNFYFTTHSKSFDNASVFIPKNHVDTIISEDNYPKEMIVGTFGVPDHVEFDKAIDIFNQQPATEPFFASILTTSNHPPIVIPQNVGFKPRSKVDADAVIEYADWAIGNFMQKASQQPWFKKTVFVFVADHGANRYASNYDLILNYNHIPFIIYSPGLINEPKQIPSLCCQIDVMPTIMGLLNCSYINNTPGLDVLHQKRPYIFFSADDKLACIDEEFLFVYRQNKTESLYKFKTGDLKDFKTNFKSKVDSMRNYTFSMMQASQCAIINDKVGWVQDLNLK
jgi:phosphoglycerol transferase MdoB-like AlkP superfamily enzyme